ncbi:MAG: ABC transporter permease subunit [Candidatus Latescibacteria bacterium]|nr:ABC transporter permease subunit [Candidatus Latescibacterota bacterium]
MHYLTVGGDKIAVTPPEVLAEEQLLVEPAAGPDQGRRILVSPQVFKNGQLQQRVQVADQFKDKIYPAKLVQRIPAGYVYVQEWILSKYGQTKPRQFYVSAPSISVEIEPVWGNYPEAIRALTAGEAAKKLPIGTLLGKTRWPWTPAAAEASITFLTYLSNTLVVAVLGVVGTLLSSSLVAYGLSRIRWRGREALFTVILATMMIPFPVLMVPLYGVFRTLGWIGTLMPLWVPAWFAGAFNIFLLRQFFLTIPEDLTDAARIDGCSEFAIYWRIMVPLAKPALAVVALFYFLHAWNDFLGPLLFLTEPDTFTMALGLHQYQSQHGGSEWHLLMAASLLLVVPIIALFFFTQKTFIQGISTTGMKG